ncbi:hypothetical protein KZX70_13340 [Paenibacillus silvae]|nr:MULTISPECIES: hypothetical protein [Paenibacillus]MCK6075832.1 hypothetical protein [Paenibacillus silvae]MCK6268519.1 hypothetical protein [Paenibacillus silvae]
MLNTGELLNRSCIRRGLNAVHIGILGIGWLEMRVDEFWHVQIDRHGT